MNILFYLLVILIIFYIDNKIAFNGETLFNNIRYKKVNVIHLVLCSFLFTFTLLFLDYLFMYLGIINNIIRIEINVKFISMMLSTIFISPFIEEYIFRFLPYKYVKKNNLKLLVIVFSSFLFTFIHKVNGIEYLLVFFSSLMLSFLMFKSESFLYSFCSHSFYNFLLVINKFLFDKVTVTLLVIYAGIMMITGILVIIGNKKCLFNN